MVFRSLSAIVAVSFGLIDPAGAQESVAPGAASPAPSSSETQSKTASEATPRSTVKKRSSSLSQSAEKPKSEQATFGAGCFWHVEEFFERLKGVNSAVSGYAGGGIPYPSYEMVHEGNTGHAEVVMVDFNPDVITYEDLLKVFWKNHDPTTINRQGPDEGPQYRSVIFYHTEDQRRAALASYRELTDKRAFRAPIVTQLMPMKAFYRAEDYHQDYYGGKPRASTRRKATSAKSKKSRVTKGKNTPAAIKPVDSDPSEPAVSPGAESKDDPVRKS